MNFSASELVKRSASQLLYKEVKKLQWQATPRQYRGNKYADDIVQKEEASSEKRGAYNINAEDVIFFCIDLVKDDKFVEIKMVEGEYESWYLESSILQACFYKTLLSKCDCLFTPKFRLKEGYKQEALKVPTDYSFELWFGDIAKYSVQSNERLLDHYVNKANLIKECLSTVNFDPCREFDSKYKFKEFNIYKPKYKIVST